MSRWRFTETQVVESLLEEPTGRPIAAHCDVLGAHAFCSMRSPSSMTSSGSSTSRGAIEPPSTRKVPRRMRRSPRARSAKRSAGRTAGGTRRRTWSDGRPGRGTSPARVALERRERPRPARRRPGPPRGGVGQPAARRAGRNRRGNRRSHARPLTSPDTRQDRRNPLCLNAAGHRRPFRRRQRRHGSFQPGSPR